MDKPEFTFIPCPICRRIASEMLKVIPPEFYEQYESTLEVVYAQGHTNGEQKAAMRIQLSLQRLESALDEVTGP